MVAVAEPGRSFAMATADFRAARSLYFSRLVADECSISLAMAARCEQLPFRTPLDRLRWE